MTFALISKKDVNVYTFSVSDKFGDSDCGLCIIIEDRVNQMAYIDTMLMSCRILGRNIEYAFMNFSKKLKEVKLN